MARSARVTLLRVGVLVDGCAGLVLFDEAVQVQVHDYKRRGPVCAVWVVGVVWPACGAEVPVWVVEGRDFRLEVYAALALDDVVVP